MKIDLLGYFMSLPREYLYKQVMWGLDRLYPEGGVVYEMCKFLWKQVLFDDPTDGVRIKGKPSDWDILPRPKSLFYAPEGKGIVIGNLTSQWVSNMALDPLDRYVTLELGCKYYGRYVDDAYFVAESKEELLEMRGKVVEFLENIGLKVHPKKFHLQPVKNGVNFLGVVIYPHRVVLGKRFIKKLWQLKRNIDREGVGRKQLDSVMAYYGLAQHYNHEKTFKRIFGPDIFKDIKKWQNLR